MACRLDVLDKRLENCGVGSSSANRVVYLYCRIQVQERMLIRNLSLGHSREVR